MKTKKMPASIEARLAGLHLKTGSHKCVDEGLCAMEAVAWLKGETHSDHPECACPVLGAIVRPWNDRADDATRQKLKPLLPRLAESKSTPAVEKKRAFHFIDGYVRRIVPGILDEMKLGEWAAKLRELDKICDETTARRSRDVVSSFADFLANPPSTSPAPSHPASKARDLALDLARDLALDLARALDLDLARALSLDLALDLDRARALDLDLALALIFLPTLQLIEEALAITK